jgi:hypothetical protein
VEREDKYCDLNYFVSCVAKISRYAVSEVGDMHSWIPELDKDVVPVKIMNDNGLLKMFCQRVALPLGVR